MTARRFLVLLHGLSSDSLWGRAVSDHIENSKKHAQSAEEANAFMKRAVAGRQ